MEIRNIAVIAHVDHGKTTLTDKLLQQCGMVKENVSMDSNVLEQERGITIYAKNTSLFYKDTKINILDTPGHADFSSEVERVLRSVDSVLLLVDALEGPMPQTKFVLRKSLELGLIPILILNKIDKPGAKLQWAQDQVYECFFDLGANDEQLDFQTLYAIGKDGIAKRNPEDISENLDPLLDIILETVPPASNKDQEPFRAQVFNLSYDNFLGRMGICRIYEGKINEGGNLIAKDGEGEIFSGKITKIFSFSGHEKEAIQTANTGDIVMIAGFPKIYIGQTLVDNSQTPTMAPISIDPPTVSLNVLVNDSPLSGKSGDKITSRQIRERLEKETEINVGLKIDISNENQFIASGRGELHLAILLENMRREGFELSVSQPQVISQEKDGELLEPFEETTLLIPEESSGTIIEKLSKRKGMMTSMENKNNQTKLLFEIPTRGLLGYREEFIIDTKGEGILASTFLEFRPHAGKIIKTQLGSMVSMAAGKASGFSLFNLQGRGTLYISPNDEIYEGMIIGNTARGNDMLSNPTKTKQLTNMRSSGADEAIKLTPPMQLSLERGLSLLKEDEYLEITPKNIRLRKKFLKESNRKRQK